MARNVKTWLFNPNTTPVVFDGEGRIVAGGERVPVDKVDKVGQEAVDGGVLVLEEPDQSKDKNADEEDAVPAVRAPGASAQKKLT